MWSQIKNTFWDYRTFEDHRRNGLAQTLIGFTIIDAKGRNINKIHLHCGLETKKPAWTLYEKLGFKSPSKKKDLADLWVEALDPIIFPGPPPIYLFLSLINISLDLFEAWNKLFFHFWWTCGM